MSLSENVFECRKDGCTRVFLTEKGRGSHENGCREDSVRDLECGKCGIVTEHKRVSWLKYECVDCGTWQMVRGPWDE